MSERVTAREIMKKADTAREKFSAVAVIFLFSDGRWSSISAGEADFMSKAESKLRQGGEPIGFIGFITEPPMGQVWPEFHSTATKESSDDATKRLRQILDRMARNSDLHLITQVRSRDKAN